MFSSFDLLFYLSLFGVCFRRHCLLESKCTWKCADVFLQSLWVMLKLYLFFDLPHSMHGIYGFNENILAVDEKESERERERDASKLTKRVPNKFPIQVAIFRSHFCEWVCVCVWVPNSMQLVRFVQFDKWKSHYFFSFISSPAFFFLCWVLVCELVIVIFGKRRRAIARTTRQRREKETIHPRSFFTS